MPNTSGTNEAAIDTSMTKQQLKEFFVWFQGVIPERLDVLIKAVHETPGFESWDPDFSPESLDGLGNWFAGEVETHQRRAAEMEVGYETFTTFAGRTS